jgi:hypothetical protein
MGVLLGSGSAHLHRRVAASAVVLAVVALTGGCGFLSALARPAPPVVTPSGSATASSASGSAASAGPVSSAAADLVASTNGRPASLVVTVAPVVRGVPPLQTLHGLLGQDCHLAADATEYAEVSVGFTDRGPQDTKQDDEASNMRVDLAVSGGGGVGVFVRSDYGDYCNGASVLPSKATLQTQDLAGEHQTWTVYVVTRTVSANPNPLQGVTLQLRDPRRHPDEINAQPWTWNVAHLTAGSACPGHPNWLCLPMS